MSAPILLKGGRVVDPSQELDAVRDVLLTRDEIAGLMANLLVTNSPPAGTTKLSEWAREHAADLGRRYASELGRRGNRSASYLS